MAPVSELAADLGTEVPFSFSIQFHLLPVSAPLHMIAPFYWRGHSTVRQHLRVLQDVASYCDVHAIALLSFLIEMHLKPFFVRSSLPYPF
jgi:hypothetical protein